MADPRYQKPGVSRLQSQPTGLADVGSSLVYVISKSVSDVTASVNVQDYYYHAVQPVWHAAALAQSTSSITLQSSLNDTNWVTDFSATFKDLTAGSSSLLQLTGKRKTFRVLHDLSGTTGNVTASLLILSSP